MDNSNSLQNVCSKIGIAFKQVAADGEWHQTDADGKSARNGSGRIKLFVDGTGGIVQNWTTMDKPEVFFFGAETKLSAADMAERKLRIEQERTAADKELAETRAKAATLASELWKKSSAVVSHPYLERKQVRATATMKMLDVTAVSKIIGYAPKAKGVPLAGNILVIPIGGGNGITSIELIDESGRKAALYGGQKAGCYWITGKAPDNVETVVIGEGVATVLSGSLAMGCVGVAALSCHNLKAVAVIIRSKHPNGKIVILSDVGNGEEAAQAAAMAVNGYLIKPVFADGCTGTDANDLHAESGIDELRRQIEAALNIDPIQAPAPAADNPLTAVVDRLAKLSALDYDKVRIAEAKAMGVRPGTLDAAVKTTKKEEESADTPFDEVEPWPEPVDGTVLLSSLVATIRRFIICEHHTAVAAALWVSMTWFMDVVGVAPLALITAPEKRCGKTLFLTLIGKLVPRPLTSSSITPSALFRSIDLWKPTLLIDETDACLKDNEELRGLINCGHTRDSAYTIRCVGDDHTPTKFNVWGAKALSGIGHPADTLLDRSIVLELRRKLPTEKVERIRHAEDALFHELSAKLARFAADNSTVVCLARPALPPSLNDRAQDNWEPLLQIATVAGGDWHHAAVAAALKIAGDGDQSPTVGAELLADIQEIFRTKKIERIFSSELVKALCSDDEKMWLTYNRGFPIKTKQLANRLKPYGVHSKSIRIGTDNAKGFELDQFKEAFTRYTVDSPFPSVTTSQPLIPQGLSDFSKRHTEDVVTDEKPRISAPLLTCDVVTDRIPLQGDADVFDLSEMEFEVAL